MRAQREGLLRNCLVVEESVFFAMASELTRGRCLCHTCTTGFQEGDIKSESD